MKKLFLLSILVSLVCATQAQTEFSVPAPTLEEKYNMTNMLMNNNILALITVAKNDGMTPEELGKKSGKLAIPFWDENGGFEPYVNFLLYAWACTGEGVQIMEQSKEKLVVKVSSLYQALEDEGAILGSTVEDYRAFFNAMLNVIALHYDRSLEMTWGENGYKIVIAL